MAVSVAQKGEQHSTNDNGGDDGHKISLWRQGVDALRQVTGLQRDQINNLEHASGTRPGRNEFLKFVAVWLGLLICFMPFIAARVAYADDYEFIKEMARAFPEALPWVGGGVPVVSAVIAGFVAHGLTRTTYARCMTVGMKWGSVIGLAFVFAPLGAAIVKWLIGLMK